MKPPKDSFAQGNGLDFSDEHLHEAEEIYEHDVDDDEDWEPYGLDELL